MQDARKTKAQLIAELNELRETTAGCGTSSTERQLAVERVRAAAMAMNAASDLLQVVAVLFGEIRRLGIDSPAASIAFIDETASTVTRYGAFVDPLVLGYERIEAGDQFVSVDGSIAAVVSSRPFESDAEVDAWRSGNVITRPHTVGPGGTETDFYVRNFGLSQEAADALVHDSWLGEWIVTSVPFRFGIVAFRQRQHHPDFDEIVADLARGLELGFLRFLDFQRIESQNRELTIQNSLERVRARALGMQESDELSGVVWDLLEESRAIGLPVLHVQIGLIHEADHAEVWGGGVFSPRLDSDRPMYTHNAPAQREDVTAARDRGEPWHVGEILVAETSLEKWREQAKEIGELPEDARSWLESTPTSILSHRVFFSEGIVAYHAPRHMGDEELSTLKRFTDVFDFAYGRFLELQQKEERNRQLAVERAAERVRAEVASMAESDDIGQVMGVIFNEMRSLDVPVTYANIIIHEEEKTDTRQYAMVPRDVYAKGFAGDPDVREIVDGVDLYRGDRPMRIGDSLSSDESEATLEDLDHSIEDWPAWQSNAREQFGFEMPYEIRVSHQIRVPFSHGWLLFYTIPTDAFAQAHLDIAIQFSRMLSLGFARHLDFQRLEQASINKSQFLRRMSHDLRSPMNAIIGYSRLLRRRTADRLDEREQRNLANIETSSGNLLNLINDILDLSRIEAGRIEISAEPVDVRVLANECADALESIVGENVTLRRELDDVGQISSDPDRLRQVVMNLLGNATKFTESGSITLSLRRVKSASAADGGGDSTTSHNGHSIELSVADTGIGIPTDDLPHIFDEFRQVERQGGEQEGTGLGLAIARKTVDLLGGEITATSEVEKGTTFTVRLHA